MKSSLAPGALFALSFFLSPSQAAVTSVQRQPDGLLVTSDAYVLRLQPWSDGTIRVEAAPGKTLPKKRSFAVVGAPKTGGWTIKDEADRVELSSKRLRVEVDKKTDLLSFFDGEGKLLFAQQAWSFQPAKDPKRNGLEVGATFARSAGEKFFGGGVIGSDLRQPSAEINLQNDYLQMHIPILYSTRGYGFFWDNPSPSKLRLTPDSVSWQSPAGDLVDYFVMAGPSADRVVAEYRALTGAAPLFPKWAYGFWFCKNAFTSQQEILGAAQQFRERKLPIDMLVQDYFYWKPTGSSDNWANWGSHEFVKDRYPDPKKMIAQLHDDDHIHFMLVIWAKFAPEVAHFKELARVNGLFPEHNDWAGNSLRYYDPFNPKARDIYDRQVMDKLLTLGVDGFWMDGVEPEMGVDKFAAFDTGAGSGLRVANAFPLMHTGGIYEAQRARSADKRVVLLPRSAWAGSQRNSAISWTSDINMDWQTLAWQIEGLQNYSILGLPYITTDIGGYKPTPENDWELFIRWYQWGAFCPIFRVHGAPRPYPWEYGEQVEGIFKKFDELRYRLLPYIYTQAGLITHGNGTLLRPLVMDFAGDAKAVDKWDEFLFGPSLLVCPVYKSSRESVAGLDQIADLDGAKGKVSASFLPEGPGRSSFEITNDFGFTEVSGKRFKSDGFSLNGLTEEQMKTKSIRIEGTYTPKESGTFQIETSGIAIGQAQNSAVEIDGQPVQPSSPASDWHFPAFPFQAEAGKPVKFAITSDMKNLGFRFVKQLPEPTHRDVYLPEGTDWYDLWSGERSTGGKTMSVETPIDRIPVYVRAGSIVPMGPELQYANEKPADPIELRVYRGANGDFTLYEDEGDGYRYEKGVFATIPFRWDEASQTLTIGKRQGSFPGMLKNRTFRIVWVAAHHGIGGEVTAAADQEVSYTGEPITVTPKR